MCLLKRCGKAARQAAAQAPHHVDLDACLAWGLWRVKEERLARRRMNRGSGHVVMTKGRPACETVGKCRQ